MNPEKSDNNKIIDEVKNYYGKTLQKSEDLKTNACCTGDIYPQYVKDILSKIHDEVHMKYYGCGLTIPMNLTGKKILDLGSGSGRDCYIASNLVGEDGEVIGVDMTEEQLKVANKYIDYHRDAFNFKKTNIKFLKGEIEKLDQLDLPDNYFDIVISNCVINLSADKEAVLKEVYRVLKPGGEIYFSDVYSDRRIPVELVSNPVLYGECLSGALYRSDFSSLAKKVGFKDIRKVEEEVITMKNEHIEKLVGKIKFHSVTYRLFKLEELDEFQENYNQEVLYKGNIKEAPCSFLFDSDHNFKTNQKYKVSSNTFKMLEQSRFKENFSFFEDKKVHRGAFSHDKTEHKVKEKSKSSCC